MPDGLTHMLAAYAALGRYRRNGGAPLFLLGAILPDLLLRGGRLFFAGSDRRDALELFLTPLHTPVGTFLICMGFCQLFHARIRKNAFLFLYAGCLSHFLLDIFQRTIEGTGFTRLSAAAYHWLYPFSDVDFQFGLFWAEDASWALALLAPAALWLHLNNKR